MIYLDNASSTPTLKCVKDVMYSLEAQANANSLHREGVRAATLIKDAETTLLEHINGYNGKIVWTGSGSMANHLICRCFAGYHSVCSAFEHKSVLQEFNELNILPTNDFDYENWFGVHFISHMLVNNETGQIFNLHPFRQKCDHLHTDAVAALGKMRIDVEKLKCDSLSLSAHKIGGPKGVGALWIKNGASIDINHLGTLNTEGIVGFVKAVEEVERTLATPALHMKDYWFLNQLCKRLEQYTDWFLNDTAPDHVPGILNISFPGVDKDYLQYALSDKGVMVGTGAACGEGDSHVLKAMGLLESKIKSAIRISFTPHNDKRQCIDAANIIADTIKELKNEN